MGLKLYLIAILILGVFTYGTTAGIRCFTCINAPSNEACILNGTIEICAENEQSCQNELRLNSPDGFGYLLTKRCKQRQACRNNQDQNKMPAWDTTQCDLLFEKNSVCRCCCNDDLCNKKELPCSDMERCPSRGDVENGEVICSNNNFLGTSCEYRCNEGFDLEGERVIECVESDTEISWTGEAPVCKLGSCISFMQAPVNGKMSCSNGNRIRSSCSFECSLGYKLVGASTTECQTNGQWGVQPPRCERIRCTRQQVSPAHGSVVCSSRNFYNSVCQFACSEDYYMIGARTTNCQLDSTWSDEEPTCERIFCDPLPEEPLNGGISCTDENFVKSSCRYSCNAGYFLEGSPDITCLSDFTWSAPEPICEQVICSPRPSLPGLPNNGDVVCSDGNLFASVCAFSCHEGYYREGSLTTTCQQNFKWSDNSPECKRIICSETHDVVEYGKVECTEGSEYGSICKFSCNAGFFVVGSDSLTCQDDFKWSENAPVCEAYTCFPELVPPSNGQLTCSDVNKSFSQCEYACGDGSGDWEIKGETKTECIKNPFADGFSWENFEPPCCAKRCPPYAQIDLFIILDSSSSVGRENWNKTLNFVAGVLADFAVSEEDLLLGLIRYNSVVDETSEIKIGQYKTKESTIRAVLNMPYDGEGTNTGNALQYAVDNMLTHLGNRPTVQDMVLLVTDGMSRDDVILPARKLRATGTNVVALGISNQSGTLKEKDILDITDDPDKTVLLTTGFDGLTPDIVKVFITQICRNPCDRQNQYGSFAANFLP